MGDFCLPSKCHQVVLAVSGWGPGVLKVPQCLELYIQNADSFEKQWSSWTATLLKEGRSAIASLAPSLAIIIILPHPLNSAKFQFPYWQRDYYMFPTYIIRSIWGTDETGHIRLLVKWTSAVQIYYLLWREMASNNVSVPYLSYNSLLRGHNFQLFFKTSFLQ